MTSTTATAASPGTRESLLGELEDEVTVLIRRARRVIGQRARSVHPDLAPGSYLVLIHLDTCGAARLSTLVDAFEADKGAMSRKVQHLVDLGFVARTADPHDGRAQQLSLTEAGRQSLREVAQERRDLLRERLDDWDEQDLSLLVHALARYNHALA
jgi:DNA-binding MarR family transcriptional regulator